MAFEAMFQPIQIGKLTIRNRVLSTAHPKPRISRQNVVSSTYPT